MILRTLIAATLLTLASGVPADPIPAMPSHELVKAVAANELNDRVKELRWMYVIQKGVGKQTLTEEQVETAQGLLYKVTAIRTSVASLAISACPQPAIYSAGNFQRRRMRTGSMWSTTTGMTAGAIT